MRVRWTEESVADLQQISAWIRRDRTPALAIRVCRTIYSAVQSLRDNPAQGRAGKLKGTRELIVPRTPYLVVYRVGSENIEILRVLHGAQSWPPAG